VASRLLSLLMSLWSKSSWFSFRRLLRSSKSMLSTSLIKPFCTRNLSKPKSQRSFSSFSRPMSLLLEFDCRHCSCILKGDFLSTWSTLEPCLLSWTNPANSTVIWLKFWGISRLLPMRLQRSCKITIPGLWLWIFRRISSKEPSIL